MQYFIDGKYRKIYYNKSTGISFYKSRGKEVNVSHMFKKNGELKQQYKTELNNVNKLNNKTDSNNVNKLNNKTELNNVNKIIKNNPSILIRKTKKKKKRFLGGGNINFGNINPEMTIQEITGESTPKETVKFYIDLYKLTILLLSNLLIIDNPALDISAIKIIETTPHTGPNEVSIIELLNCLMNLFNSHSDSTFANAIEEPADTTVHDQGNLVIKDLAFLRTWNIPDGIRANIKFTLKPRSDADDKIKSKFLSLEAYIPILNDATAHQFETIDDINTQNSAAIKAKITHNVTNNGTFATGATEEMVVVPEYINTMDSVVAGVTPPHEFTGDNLAVLIEVIKKKIEEIKVLETNITNVSISVAGALGTGDATDVVGEDSPINSDPIKNISLNARDATLHFVKIAILNKHYLMSKTLQANAEILQKLFT
jgi:hypothetical protein